MTTKAVLINVKETSLPKWKDFDFSKAKFGYTPTDHMFICEYSEGKWNNPRIQPFNNLNISPFFAAFHYGQSVFEGMKAFKMKDGKVAIFRLYDHAARFNKSLTRLCMPNIPESLFVESVSTLVDIDRNWVPGLLDSSLYIRPIMISSDERLGVRPSDNYIFMVVCSPSLAYYSAPLKVKLETSFSRAFPGGTGFTKCGGNYGASFYPYKLAQSEGFDQIIWTDAQNHENIEESGTMNLGFISENNLITPPTGETILSGITRDSVLKIAPLLGLKVIEQQLKVNQLEKMLVSSGKLEAFGIGTAATIAPISEISLHGKIYSAYIEEDAKMYALKKLITEMRLGIREEKFGWNTIL